MNKLPFTLKNYPMTYATLITMLVGFAVLIGVLSCTKSSKAEEKYTGIPIQLVGYSNDGFYNFRLYMFYDDGNTCYTTVKSDSASIFCVKSSK